MKQKGEIRSKHLGSNNNKAHPKFMRHNSVPYCHMAGQTQKPEVSPKFGPFRQVIAQVNESWKIINIFLILANSFSDAEY